MKKIRLCFVMPGCYPLFRPESKETFGGSEVELFNLARYFSAQQGYQVDFLVGDYGQKVVEMHGSIRLRKMKYFTPQATKSPVHKLLKILLLVKTLLFQPSDIFITKTANEFVGWLVLVCKWGRGKNVVFRLGSDRDTDLAYWKERSFRLYWLYRLGLHNCDRILCQSQAQRLQLYRNCKLDAMVVKNVFPITSAPLKKKRYVLWVSRCMALKRPLLFLELARRIPKERFVMIMPQNHESKAFAGEQITALARKVIEEAQTLPNLTLIDYVPFDEIQNYYDEAKIFVNTSEFEGFPNSFIQACLGRTGVLSLKVDPDGFITRNNIGLCCGDDFEKAVGFIKELNEPKVTEYGHRAFEYVKKNHDIRKIASQYAMLFEQLSGVESADSKRYRSASGEARAVKSRQNRYSSHKQTETPEGSIIVTGKHSRSVL